MALIAETFRFRMPLHVLRLPAIRRPCAPSQLAQYRVAIAVSPGFLIVRRNPQPSSGRAMLDTSSGAFIPTLPVFDRRVMSIAQAPRGLARSQQVKLVEIGYTHNASAPERLSAT
ncbi:hypothetical protein ACUSIJ_13340 [Pseudochelatococcus sp. B33]